MPFAKHKDPRQVAHFRSGKAERGGFPCPGCGELAGCIDTRMKGASQYRRRRHQCVCGCRFNTIQVLAAASPAGARLRPQAAR